MWLFVVFGFGFVFVVVVVVVADVFSDICVHMHQHACVHHKYTQQSTLSIYTQYYKYILDTYQRYMFIFIL